MAKHKTTTEKKHTIATGNEGTLRQPPPTRDLTPGKGPTLPSQNPRPIPDPPLPD